jgi:O-succinylbenzoic acid--CoA ligase
MQTGAIAPLPTPAFLSLVPTQLQRLLKGDLTIILWLQSFTAILLGGAPAGATLLDKARNLHLPLAPTYGMTETASQVATLLPQEFLAGNLSSGRILPHARLTIQDETGKPLPPFTPGRITLSGTSLAQGYGSTPLSQPWQSGDLGYLDSDGYLYVLGRENTLIITGGEKVLPAEVEAAILATSYASDVAVLGVPDQEWGEQVVAVVIPTHQAPLPPVLTIQLCAALKLRLSSYKIPKQWLLRKCLPRNAQGKLNQTELRQWVIQRLGSQPVANDRVPQAMDDVDG